MTLIELPAAARAAQPHPKYDGSESYSFFSTQRILEALESEGWLAAEARAARGRSLLKQAYGKHQVTVAHRDDLAHVNRDMSPRIIIDNSHDGNSKLKMRAGAFREICSNGMVVADSFIQSVLIKHTHRTIEEVIAAALAFRANNELLREKVEEFKARELSVAEADAFAQDALALRFSADSGVFLDRSDILAVRRLEDAGNSLWRCFNRAQEALLQGKFHYEKAGLKKPVEIRKARAINSIAESTRINTALWDLAEMYLVAQ